MIQTLKTTQTELATREKLIDESRKEIRSARRHDDDDDRKERSDDDRDDENRNDNDEKREANKLLHESAHCRQIAKRHAYVNRISDCSC